MPQSHRLRVARMELLRNMLHQSIRLDRVLSDSGQRCVDLSPIKNYNFGWGPNFIAYPSSLAHTFQARQSFKQSGGGIDRILCDSDPQLRIWALSKITLLDGAPTFYSNHVLCFTCSTNESWTLHLFFATVLPPSDDRLTLWQWAQSKAAPDTILPIVQWRCRLQSPRSLAFMSCMFAALYTSIGCHQTQHATAFYIWTSPLCSSCACICMSISLCRYRVLIFFLYFLSSYIYIHLYLFLFIYICIHLYLIYAYIILYMYTIFSISLARF